MRALVAGWFSFEGMGATAGDLMACDVACEWLESAGANVDVASVPPFEGDVRWEDTDPEDYSHVVFVCGPFGNGTPITEFLDHFAGRTFVGLDVTMVESIADWNPFDLLIERDSPDSANPDFSFLSSNDALPLIGVIKVHDQPYPGAMHEYVREVIDGVASAGDFTPVVIDTQLDIPNANGFLLPAQIESLIARMDAVITMRMHGLVLALKNGVPAVAIDPIAGGHKVTRQARAVNWDILLPAEELTEKTLKSGLDRALTEGAKKRAEECARRARDRLQELRAQFLNDLGAVVP